MSGSFGRLSTISGRNASSVRELPIASTSARFGSAACRAPEGRNPVPVLRVRQFGVPDFDDECENDLKPRRTQRGTSGTPGGQTNGRVAPRASGCHRSSSGYRHSFQQRCSEPDAAQDAFARLNPYNPDARYLRTSHHCQVCSTIARHDVSPGGTVTKKSSSELSLRANTFGMLLRLEGRGNSTSTRLVNSGGPCPPIAT